MKSLILSALFIATVVAYSSSSSSSSSGCSEENDSGNNDSGDSQRDSSRRNDGRSITINNVQVMQEGSSGGSRKDDDLKCESGWKRSNRKMGVWCIRVFGGSINLEQARNKCNNHGAVVSSVENSHERHYIIKESMKIFETLVNINYGSVWIGGQRLKGCRGDKKNDVGCVPWAKNAYEWTDGFTTGKKMMRFRPGQPDYLHDAQNNIYMHIIYRPPGPINTTSGDLDDISWDTASSPSLLQYVRGYVCGKKARHSH